MLAHCSPGDVRQSKTSKEALKEFPSVNFCLAHFGGAEEWERRVTGETPRRVCFYS